MKKTGTVLLIGCGLFCARAEVKTETVEYNDGNTLLEGYLVYDTAVSGKRPGVLIVHQWKGVGPYEKKRAEMLAPLGDVAFALDIYRQGIRPATPKPAAAESTKYKPNRAPLRKRAQAGLDVLLKKEL